MKRKRTSIKGLVLVASVKFMFSHAFQFSVDHRKIQTMHKISYRRPNSYFLNEKDSDLTINSEPPAELNPGNTDNSVKEGPSHQRIGGRRKNVQRKQDRSVSPLSFSGILEKYRKFIFWGASALLVGAILFGQLSHFSSPSYVYYQRSVIESRIVGSDGNIQTSRKETFKSNVPELVREQQKRSSSSTDVRISDSQSALIRSEERRLSEEMDQFEKSSARIRRELDSSIEADLNRLMNEFFYE
jgi:hypothetical protein